MSGLVPLPDMYVLDPPHRLAGRAPMGCPVCLAICYPEDPSNLDCPACAQDVERLIQSAREYEVHIAAVQKRHRQKERAAAMAAHRRRKRDMNPDGPEGFYHRDRFGKARRS